MIDRYHWRGGSEMMLRSGGDASITLLILPALFEESNRMRRFTVSLMRNLADLGIGTILPDLPGTGESLSALADVSLDDWRDAVTAVSALTSGSVAIRGGALLDTPCKHRWRLAPDTGERLLRDMVRATAFSQSAQPSEIDRQARTEPTALAGNMFSPGFYLALHGAAPTDDAHVCLIEGPKLWRAAEPSDDPEFSRHIAQDIFAWTKTCGI